MVSAPTSGFTWSWLALPYLIAALAIFAVLVTAAIRRGDRMIRIGLVSATGSLMPWSLATALVTCLGDAELARRLHQLGNGPTMLLGPSLLLVLLAVSGQLDRFRYLARIAIATGAVLLLVSWSTRLIIHGVITLPSGVLFPEAGPLEWMHALQVVAWPAAGLFIAMRAAPAAQRAGVVRYLAALPVLAMVATADTLMAYGVGGVYPLAWLPALLGSLLCLHLILRTELLRGRGTDRGVLWALVAHVGAGALIAGVVWLATGEGELEPAAVALLTAPLWGAAVLGSWALPRNPAQAEGAGYEQALERFARELTSADGSEAGQRLARLWSEHVGLGEVRLLRDLGELSATTRAWLCSLDAPVMASEVAMMRLGQLRASIDRMFTSSGAVLAVPIIDRGELIAVAVAGQLAARPLRDAERLFLFDSAQLVGNSLIYAGLAQDAKLAAAAAREVDIANALAGHYRPLADDDTGSWQLAIHHQPSAHPGGDGWSWALLGPSRIAVMVVEAETAGVAGALVVAALQGAFAARSRDPACTAADLLEALGDTAPGSRRKALVVVLDGEARTMTWASEGHHGAMGALILGPEGTQDPFAGSSRDQGSTPLPPQALVLLLSSGVAAAPGLAAALDAGRGRGLRLVAEILELAATASAPGPSRELLAVGLMARERPAR